MSKPKTCSRCRRVIKDSELEFRSLRKFASLVGHLQGLSINGIYVPDDAVKVFGRKPVNNLCQKCLQEKILKYVFEESKEKKVVKIKPVKLRVVSGGKK